MASRPVRLLLVAAHPADTFDQAGGTLAHHIARGDQVTVVSVTTGVRSHDWELIDAKDRSGQAMDVEERVQAERDKKLDELRGACAILGIEDIRTLGFEDDEELITEDLVVRIAELFREVRPDVVITHHPYEEWGLKLHATVGRATLFAFRKAATSGRGKSQASHRVPSIYFMNPMAYVGVSLSNAFAAHIDVYVDISDVIDKKVRALDRISSQYYGGSYARKRAEACDGHWGSQAQVAYAEPFQRYYQWVTYTLPISDFELHRAEEPIEQQMMRRSTCTAAHIPLPEGSAPAHVLVDKELYDQ